ncbi:MAG: peptidase family protein [Myxococcaceae bacterium]|nr:peptidase family protein [Myxococcaceae bacterium]
MSAAPTIFCEPAHDLPLVDVFIHARTGAQHDPAGQEGALNLALRTLRRGTRTRSAREIDALVDRLGAEFGPSVDASSAGIHAAVIRRNVPALLDLVVELLTDVTLPEAEIAQVRREVKADIVDGRDDDRSLAGRHFRRTLFAGHPYGRPAAGTLGGLDGVDRAAAHAAFQRTFCRDNLVFSAAGDITAAELTAFADRLLPSLSAQPAPSTAVPPPKPVRGRRLLIVDKPDRTQTQIYIGNLGTQPRDRDHFALMVGNTLFGGTFTARLMREIRSKRGLSYGASSRLSRDRAREAWAMWTFPAATDAPLCVGLQLSLLERLLERGATAREVSFARSFLTRNYAFDRDTATKRLMQRLDVELLDLPKSYYSEYVDRVNAVTADDVNAALRRRLSADDLLITVVATAETLRGPLEAAIPGLRDTRVIPFDHD